MRLTIARVARRFGAIPLALSALLLAAVHADGQTVNRTVDAAAGWIFVSLDDPEGVLPVTDPATSTAWDIAFFGTEVMVNGGEMGPGEVTVHCVCRNRAATNDEIMYMTAESEQSAFDAVGRADVPASPDAWHPAAFGDANWYRYNLRDEHFIWSLYDVYLLKRGDEVYKLQITGYYGRAGEPRQISFRYAPVE